MSSGNKAYHSRIAQDYWARHNWPIQQTTTIIETRLLSRYIPDGRTLLAGVGGGREIPALLTGEREIVALDSVGEMVAAGLERFEGEGRVRWVVADMSALPLLSGSFDSVVSLAAVNYVENLRAAVRDLLRVLRPGGVLAVSAISSAHRTERKISPSRTRRAYRPAELTELIESLGGKVEAVRRFRVIADLLPPGWNRPDQGGPRRLVMNMSLQIDRCLATVNAPLSSKFFWIVARR